MLSMLFSNYFSNDSQIIYGTSKQVILLLITVGATLEYGTSIVASVISLVLFAQMAM